MDINEIISKSAIQGIIRTTEELEKAYLKIQDIIVSAKELNNTLASAKGFANLNKQVEASAIKQEQLRKAIASAQLQEERLSAFRENEVKKEEARQDRIKRARDKTQKNATGSGDYNPYKELDDQYKAAAVRAQNLGAQLAKLQALFGASPTAAETARLKALANSFEEASKEAAALQAQLAKIDEKVGKYGRNVGNYKSGFNGLQNSINQITREFPAFAVSVQTGILALSNNIPIFFDEIKRTRLEIAALRKEGKEVPSLLKQLMNSVFSWGTALSLGITLLTVFGKEIGEFIKALFKGAKALDYFAERQKMMLEVRRKGFGDAQTEIVNLQNLYRASQNVNLSMDERKKAVDELQRRYPQTFKNLKDEDILVGKAAGAYSNLTNQILATAFASVASAKIAENRLREFDNEEIRIKARIDYMKEEIQIAKLRAQAQNTTAAGAVSGSSNSQGFYAAIAAAEERRAAAGKIIREANRDSAELNARNLKLIQEIDKQVQQYGVTVLGVNSEINEQINTDEIDLKIQRAKNRSDELKATANNAELELEIRLNAAKSLAGALADVARLEAEKELMNAENTAFKITAINEQKNYEIRKGEIESTELILKINQGANAKLAGMLKQGLKEYRDAENARVQAVIDSQNYILELIEDERAARVAKQSELYSQGKISKEQYEKEIRNIEFNARKDSIQEQIDVLDSTIAIQKEGLDFGIYTQKEVSDNERKASRLRIALSQLESDEKISIKEKELEKEREIQAQLQQLYQETFDFARQLVNGAFEKNIQRLEKEKEAATEKKDRDIENVEESLLSEEQKTEQIAIINSQAEAKQKEIDARIAAQKRKQAIADKAAALAQIAINTAVAVTTTLKSTGIFGLPLTSILIAFGALQAATVLATPIPEFRHGGTMKHDGIAKFGEVGQELRLNPDGSTELTPASTSFGFVEKGTQFFSNQETKKILAKPEKFDHAGKSWDIGPLVNEYRNGTKRVEKAISKLSSPSTIITKNGWRTKNQKVTALNNYLKRNLG